MRVLLMATVILMSDWRVDKWNSKGRCPPLWSPMYCPFTHCTAGRHKEEGKDCTTLGHLFSATTCTHHHGVVVGTLKVQPVAGAVPTGGKRREGHCPLVPHPSHVVTKASLMSQVIETGWHSHQEDRAGL